MLSSVFSEGTIAGKNNDRSSPVSTSIATMSSNQDSFLQPYIPGFLNESAAVGIDSGLGYLPFILTGDQRNDPRRYDLEAGLHHSELP